MSDGKQHGLRKFRAMWGSDVSKHFLWKREKPSGEVTYSVYEKGRPPAMVIIDEDHLLASQVTQKMLDAGVDVIASLDDGLARGFFTIS